MSGWTNKTFTDVSFNLLETIPGANALVTDHYGDFLFYPFNTYLEPYMTGTPASSYRVYNSSQMAAQLTHVSYMAGITNDRDFAVQLFHKLDANGYVNLKDNNGNNKFRFGFRSAPTEYYFSITWYMEDGAPGTVFRRDTDTYPDYYEGSVLRIPVLGFKGKYIDFNNSNRIDMYDYTTQNTAPLTGITRNKMTEIHEYEWLAPLEDSELYFTSRLTGTTYGTTSNIKFTSDCVFYIINDFYLPNTTPSVHVEEPTIYISSATPSLYTDAESGFTTYASQQSMAWPSSTLPGTHIMISAIDVKMTPGTPPEPGEEPEYMNDLNNRFSPRAYAGSIGNYIVPANTITDVMDSIYTTDLADIVLPAFTDSTDGKEFILGLRWYWGFGRPGSPSPYIDSNRFPIKVGACVLTSGSSTIYAYRLVSEYFDWSTSELPVPAYFNNYLDYMCSYQLYLPYYGFLDIDPNDIVGGTIKVHYGINWCTGMTNITVECKNERTGNKATKYYTLNTQIGEDIPYAADVLKDKFLAWAQTCGKAFSSGAKIGMSAASQDMNAFIKESNQAESFVTNNDNLSADQKLESIGNIRNTRDEALQRYRKTEFNNTMVQNGIDKVAQPVQTVTRSGSFSAETGNLDELYPYLLITKPVTVEPSDYEEFVGLPSSESAILGNCSGFTQIAALKATPVLNTLTVKRPKYINEIISLLQAGVYL